MLLQDSLAAPVVIVARLLLYSPKRNRVLSLTTYLTPKVLTPIYIATLSTLHRCFIAHNRDRDGAEEGTSSAAGGGGGAQTGRRKVGRDYSPSVFMSF